MDVPLISQVAGALASRGFAALRFNFAGVGASGGRFTDGIDEPLDVRAAFDYVGSRSGVDAGSISIAGWSFGSWMALLALADGLPAQSCVAIAPPLAACGWTREAGRISRSKTRRHYIVGDRDQFCGIGTLESFAAAARDDPRGVTVLEGADHFLFGREGEVARLVAELLE